MEPELGTVTKRRELQLFLFLTIAFIPMLAVAIIVTYGFIVWFFQMLMGPPTV